MDAAEDERWAWVDESGSNRQEDPGTYLLAAAIVSRSTEDAVRAQLAELLLPGQVKVHWRDESATRRAFISGKVAQVAHQQVVVVRNYLPEDRVERRRRKCLERLLYELAARGVFRVVLESRGPSDDRRDIEMVNALRGQGALDGRTRVDHRSGREEPLLWLPDTGCGAVSNARTGNPRFFESLQERVSVVTISR